MKNRKFWKEYISALTNVEEKDVLLLDWNISINWKVFSFDVNTEEPLEDITTIVLKYIEENGESR